MNGRLVTVSLVLAVIIGGPILGVVATRPRGGDVVGEGRLEPSGRVVLTRDGKAQTVTSSRPLRRGDLIEVAEGTAKVALPGGDGLELRQQAVVVLDGGPELRTGRLLITAGSSPRMVRAAGSEVVVAGGAVRLDLTLALRAATYVGRSTLRSGGRSLEVPALRETALPAEALLPSSPTPLVVDRNDAWDQRFLPQVVAHEADLENRARGFTAQVAASEGRPVGFYRQLLPGLDAESAFQQAQVDQLGPPGEVLLGSAVALLGKKDGFGDRIAGATSFRQAGASWALVAVDQGVPSLDGLIRLVDGAVNQAPLELAAPAPPSPTTVAPVVATPTTSITRPRSTTPAGGPSRGSPTTPTTRAGTPPTTSPSPAPSPAPGPAPSPPPLGVLDPVVQLLQDLLG